MNDEQYNNVRAVYYAYDHDEIELYTNVAKVSCAIDDLRQEVRAWLKYPHTKTADQMIDSIYESLCQIGGDV